MEWYVTRRSGWRAEDWPQPIKSKKLHERGDQSIPIPHTVVKIVNDLDNGFQQNGWADT
jgi:hypothetical protein